jgi:hypothetical protein
MYTIPRTVVAIAACSKVLLVAAVLFVHPVSAAIIYQNNFDGSPLGPYTEVQANKEFPNLDRFSNFKTSNIQIIEGSEAFSGRSLKVEIVHHSHPNASQVALHYRLPGGGYDDVYTSYMFTTSPNFKTEAGGKLAALAGSEYATYYLSGRCLSDGEFNSKPHLGGAGAHNYTFHYAMRERCAGGVGFWWDGSKGRNKRTGPVLNNAHGTWHHIEFRIKVNTPGQADGILQTWYDGELVLSNTSMEWRKTGAHNVERAKLQAFTSGRDAIKERGQFIYYDNYVVSTTRMGPPAGVGKTSTLSDPNSTTQRQ